MKAQDSEKYDVLIKEKCDKRLLEMFPAGIPEEVTQRYQRELDYMLITGSQEALVLYSELSEKAARENVPLLVRGTTRCSLLTFLLGDSLINPLNAYYYCPECGYYERITEQIYGMDAPRRGCPKCGAEMTADGFSLEENFVWNMGQKPIYFEYGTVADFVPLADQCIHEFYNGRAVMPLAGEEWADDKKTGNYCQIGFTILPAGKNQEDYAEYLKTLPDGTKALYMNFDDSMERELIRILIMDYQKADLLKECLQRQDMNLSDVTIDDLRDIGWREMTESGAMFDGEAETLRAAQPQTFYGCIQTMCALQSTYEDKPGMLFASRDALFRYLMREFAERNIDKTLLFEIADFVRKGKAAKERWKEKWNSYIEKANLTEEVISGCERCRYLWPEAHVLDYLMLYAMMAKIKDVKDVK